ncbi:DUF5979 domain-containing protein [Corynebacterium glutamicum]|uniref:DUF5979 domain-containing protein n=2 Tax=Corynebacterium glutamicum TaxID=1718 RepID=UPI00119E1E20|nr:DUF5979 domain-containing protein [Corynebacterium glutamicum]TWS34591.1 hypothetical protein AKJ19_08870 [Corynebacterium glutamicum]TWS52446.1 hypothetical protein AKJ26_02925 [Corynebacterium glutamicum]TWS58293.1 hypothetical protein AKJ27_03730 [Corynebacterium glutamicum]
MTNSTFKNLGKSKGVKRVFGAVMATALAMAGVTVVNSAESGGNSCEPEIVSVNPMGASTPIGSADGYTIFVKDDAIFANSEMEGTIAVGGTATFGDPRGFQSPQYPIMHSTGAGNDAYGVPIIDGEGNRVLLNEIAFSGNKVVQIQNRGSVRDAGAKLFNHDSPENYTFGPQFGGSGTTYFPEDGGNQSPQLESQVQAWADGAGADTFTPEKSAFTDYFPADEGATILAVYTDWATPEIQAGGEARIKLDGSKPSQISLSDFGGAEKFFVENYNEDSFLVVNITSADLSNGILKLPSIANQGNAAPANGQLSHVLWDLSGLTGDVTITTFNEPVRGAIYAPNAHVIFPAESDGGKEFEGQIISNKFTALHGGKEMHTNLFKGRFTTEKPCEETPEGGFSLKKVVEGVDEADLDGKSFTVTASWEGGSKELILDADGSVVAGPQDLPVGTVVSFTEGSGTAIEGYVFGGVEFDPESVTITEDGNPVVTVTNTYTKEEPKVGGFSLKKVVEGVDEADLDGKSFTVTASWEGGSKELILDADGSVVAGPQDLPVGTVVSFTEGSGTAIEGYVFGGVEFDPESVTITEDGNPVVTVTNTYTKEEPKVGGFSLKKVVEGVDEADLDGKSFTVTASWEGGSKELILDADGSVVAGPQDLPVGTVVSFTEGSGTAIEGYVFGGVEFDPESVIITEDGNPVVTVTNTYTKEEPKVGGFSLKKVVEGVDEADLDGKSFTVTASWEGGSKELILDADGSVVAGPQDLPVGTVVSFTEGSGTAIEGYVFGGVEFDPESVIITEDGNPVVTVTNTYTKEEPKVGGFSLKKVVEGVDEADLDGKSFTVTASWEGGSKELILDADGSVVAGPQDLPVGTVVSFTEGSGTAIEGYVFGGVEFDPESVIITEDGNPVVTVTNTYTEIPEPEPGKGQITVTKIVDPSVKELVGETEFQFTLRCEASEVITPLAVVEDEEASTSEIEAAAELLNAIADLTSDETLDENDEISFVLKAGESKTFDIPAGMNCTIEEVEPNTIEGITWDGVTFEVNEVEINTIEVIEGQNVSVTVTNTYTKEEPKVGGFSLKKVVEGVDEADLDGKSFTVTASWEGGSKELILDADGSVVAGPQDLPVGTVVSFTEGSGTAIEGYVFGGVEFDPESVTITEDGNPVVTVTNTYTKEDRAAEPWIGTTAEVEGAEDKVLPITGGTVIDTVEYTNLRPETEYRLEGKLVHVDADGNVTDIDVTASATFTTGAATEGNPYYVSGTTTLEFQIDEATAKQYAGENLVVFEKVFLVGEGAPEEPVATHEDPEDEAQTFEVEPGRDIEVVKSVTGPKGDQVTADEDAVFQIEATWTDRLGNAQSKVFNVIPGQPVVLEGLPLNTEITLTEVGASTSVGNVKWADIIWSGEGVVDGKGDSASATITLTKGEAPVGVDLENKTSANGLIIIPLPIPLFPGGGSSEPPAPTEPVSPVSPEEPVAPVKPGESAKPSAPAMPGETQVPEKGTPSKGGLANTGANVAWLAGGAVLLLLVGAWLTLRGRRNIK